MIQDSNKSIKKGMNRNTHPSELTQEYTFAMNANIQSENNGEQVVIQNENSNTLCSRFNEGFIVIKSQYDRVRRRTYFFLLNESTGCSEIGYIDENQEVEENDAVIKSCGCYDTAIFEEGLETVTDIQASCEYITVLSDYCELTETCTGCLGFSKLHPIKDVVIRHAVTGDELYFTDGNTFQKYINLDYIHELFIDKDPCTNEITEICIDCEKLRLFRRFDHICSTPLVIQGGGSLRAGMYEVFIVYSEENGEIISDTMSAINPISIFDVNNVLIDQTTSDYQTNLAFSFNLEGLDLNYRFFKVLLTYSSEINPAPQYYDYGTFPIDTKEIIVSSLQDISERGRESINERTVLSKRPMYKTAEGMADIGGYLIQHSLKTEREINLQQVVNYMGTFAYWQSYQGIEDLFKDGINSAKYKGYSRDETYPLGIQFLKRGGGATALFPMISRPPTPFDVEDISIDNSNDNVQSIINGFPDCSDNIRKQRWQFENTAGYTGMCDGGDATITQEYTEILSCESEPLIISEGIVKENIPNGIVAWINENREHVLSITESWVEDIQEALLSDDYTDCIVKPDGDCGEAEVVSFEVLARSVENERVDYDSIPYSEYSHSVPPSTCENVEEGVRDTAIENVLWSTAVVNKKLPVVNIACNSATQASTFLGTSSNIGFHLVDKASIGSMAPLLTTIPVSLFDGVEFQDKLHTNAVWFQTDITIGTHTAVELTNILCSSTDDNSSNKVRITVWEGCPTITEKPTYARIINDITSVNPEDLFLVFNSADFTSSTPTIYIAIDSPIRVRVVADIVFSPTNGTGVLSIEGINYSVLGAIDSNILVNSFISTHTTTANNNKMSLENVGGVLRITMSESQYTSLLFTNTTEDLNATWGITRRDYTLQPPCGCFSVVKRDVTLTGVIKYDSITFTKKYVYEFECERQIPYLKPGCGATPNAYGTFAYVESTNRYPCNSELYDSSKLKISKDLIPASIESVFESFFTTGVDGNNDYILNPLETNFMDKNVRHFKFPNNIVSPFMSSIDNNSSASIFPLGFKLSNEVINFFLDVALTNNLLTQEERDDIIGYEFFRGDRRTHRSVIAKGIGFTPLEYQENNDKVLYPNYPLNQQGIDILNDFQGVTNNNWLTFHSPETLFSKPSLGNEITVDGYIRSIATTTFAPMKNHQKMVLLGQKARTLATTIASLELTAEILSETMALLTWAGTGSGITLPASIAIGAVAIAAVSLSGLFRVGSYRYQWLQTFEGFGQGYNFAYIGASKASYNKWIPNGQSNSLYRGLDIRTYLEPKDITVRDERSIVTKKVNNHNREESVLLKFPNGYDLNPDSSVFIDNTSREQIEFNTTGTFNSSVTHNSSVPYVTIKNWLPGQWGEIGSVQWLPTNYCGRLEKDNECDGVFGGDIFISRLYIKRQFPFFRTYAWGAMNLPFRYSSDINIKNPQTFDPDNIISTGFMDYKTANDEVNFVSVVFPENKSNYLLFSGSGGTSNVNDFFVTDRYKFLTQYYGLVSFLVESEINCNFRYGRNSLQESFMPYVDDMNWIQESDVPMSIGESFFYNRIYSKVPHKKAYTTLTSDFSRERSDKQNNLDNTLIYSIKDDMSNSLRAPWRNYRALDFATFPKDVGDLIDVVGIESEIVWLRFTDSQAFYNTIDPIRERQSGGGVLGDGTMFQERAVSFNKTDLGYAGTQHKSKISTPYGHYSVDSKRGKVFEIAPNVKGLEEISLSMDKWFKDQLPFKIIKYIPNADIDNNYNGCGVTMGWDDITKRVFITKLDYIPKQNTYFDEDNGYYIEQNNERLYVDLKNESYFINASWTIAYSPITKGWISYYSFTPNYYNSLNEYFQTGVNNLGNKSHGLWTHFPFLSSYQVFYGDLYPFIVEYVEETKATHSTIESVSYWLDTRKYTNKYNYTNIFGKSFNKAYIYNDFQNTGLLLLTPQNTNDRSQVRNFPSYDGNSTGILQSEINNKWSFNHIYNAVRNEKSNLPIWLNDEVNIRKEVNNSQLDLSARRKDRVRGEFFITRLIQDEDSRFKMLFRLQSNKVNYYP